jgi:hypothetical protein
MVTAGVIEVRNSGAISGEALGSGDSGSIRMSAKRLVLDRDEISTDSTAAGGEVRLLAKDVIDLRNSAVTTSVAGGADPTAGSILIDRRSW